MYEWHYDSSDEVKDCIEDIQYALRGELTKGFEKEESYLILALYQGVHDKLEQEQGIETEFPLRKISQMAKQDFEEGNLRNEYDEWRESGLDNVWSLSKDGISVCADDEGVYFEGEDDWYDVYMTSKAGIWELERMSEAERQAAFGDFFYASYEAGQTPDDEGLKKELSREYTPKAVEDICDMYAEWIGEYEARQLIANEQVQELDKAIEKALDEAEVTQAAALKR